MKKAVKKTVSLLLAAMIISGSVAVGVAELDFAEIFTSTAEAATYSGTCGDNLTWNLDISTGVLNITGTGKMNDWLYVGNDAPWYANRSSIKSVTISNGVTSIGDYAFYDCESFESITVPDGVISIGYAAFEGCTSLLSITIPDSVTSIGVSAFENCSSLASITIPDSVTSIGNSAFWDCDSLTSITIPDSVTSIGGYAFANCNSLENVYYTGDLAGWCGIYFENYASNPMHYADNLYINGSLLEGDIVIPNGVTSICVSAFENCSSLVSVTIPDSVTSIGDRAFSNCTSLTSITIPDSVTNIGNSAFSNCSSLASITIPDSVTSIGNNAFSYCDSLASITIPDSLTSIGDETFAYCDSLTSITIPDSVTSIGYIAFYSCSSLTSITFGKNSQLTNIGYYVFAFCRSLTSITIPDSVTSIGSYAFQNCTSLASVTIGNGVTSIGDWAFDDCTSLTSITIPDSVTSIGDYVFYSCKSLEYVHIPTSVKVIGNNILKNTSAYICSTTEDCYAKTYADANNIEFKLCVGHGENDEIVSGKCGDNLTWTLNLTTCKMVITGTGDMWDWDFLSSSYPPWYGNSSSIKTVTISNDVTNIGRSAFDNCTSLTSIEIPDSVTSIGSYTFQNCTSLASITIPDSVTSIGSYAFYNCTNLASITIPDSVTSIGSYAFQNCTSLASVTIGNGVTSIGDWAFDDCISLTSITFGENSQLTNIGDSAFFSCNSLTSVTIPDSVTSIGDWAFYECTSLASITIPDSVTSISDYAFVYCTSLASVTIGNGVTSIGYRAFYNCDSLTSVTIPDSVTSIGSWAFEYCTSLASITIPDSVTSIGSWAFGACKNLRFAHIPPSVTFIGIDILCDTTAYICSTTEDCYAKTYADANGIEFRVCNGHGEKAVLTEINIKTNPEKTTYWVGDTLDTTGLTLLAKYNNGTEKIISGGFECNPTVLNTVGNQTITVSYGSKTCTFDVTVADVVLESIEINSLPIKTEYTVGETLVTTGLTLLAKYSNGTERVISGGFACSPTVLNTVGIQKITVTYGGKSCTFDVNVAEKEEAVLIKIEIYQLPDKTVYVVGDKLDTTGLQLKLIYSDGSSKLISNYAFDCTPTLLETEGMQTITLTYLGFTCTFDVRVLGDIYVEHISAQNYTGSAIVPEIKVYSTATDARLTEGVDYTVSIRNNINIGTAYVTVTGKGDYESVVNTSFNIIGDVEISKIEVHTLPEKLIYNEGDTLDTDGLVLKVTYTDGSVYYVDSGFTCTPTVLNNAGKQIITVIYEGYVCTFEVTVNEKEVEIINVYATYIVDGEVFAIYELEPGEVIPVPVNPEKEGWTFNGWTPEIPEKISYDDMTFIAVFTEGAPKFYVNEPLESYEYTGYPIMPAIDVYSTETNKILEEYVDYIINYSNNIDAGVARVEIVGIGDYDGEVIFSTFIILARRANDITVSDIPATYETGSPICVVPIVKDGKFTLVKGVDFDLEYANNVNPGTATVTIIFKGNYSGTKAVTFEILEASERFRVIEMPDIITFPQIPDWDNIIICGEDNRVLVEDTDYVIEYPEINGIGMTEIVVKGINDYEGEEFVIVVTVVATDISGIDVNYNETVVYTGTDIILDLDGKVICGNTVLVEGVDYAVEYVNNRNAGTMTVIIIGIGNYSGRTEFEVVIEKSDIGGMDVSEISDRYVYTGNEIKPEIVLGNLVLGRDYTVTYINNVNVGTATVIIKGVGNYTGEIRISFVIVDALTPALSASVSIISDISSLGYEETATLQTSVVWGDYNWGYLVWTSSNDSVATVNSVGVVNVLDEGTVTITVKLCDRNGNIIVDENGNEVSDSIIIKCTMTFWQKIVRWFRNLFAALAGIFG